MERYELGYIIRGIKYPIWTGTKFPDGKHDDMSKTAQVISTVLKTPVTFYHECNGERYSY